MKNKNPVVKPYVYNIIFISCVVICGILTFWNWIFEFERPEMLNYIRIATLSGILIFKGKYAISLKEYINNLDYRVIKKLVSQNTFESGNKTIGKPKGIIIRSAGKETTKLNRFIANRHVYEHNHSNYQNNI